MCDGSDESLSSNETITSRDSGRGNELQLRECGEGAGKAPKHKTRQSRVPMRGTFSAQRTVLLTSRQLPHLQELVLVVLLRLSIPIAATGRRGGAEAAIAAGPRVATATSLEFKQARRKWVGVRVAGKLQPLP